MSHSALARAELQPNEQRVVLLQMGGLEESPDAKPFK